MSKRYSMHFGVNERHLKFRNTGLEKLYACENDAIAMYKLAVAEKFDSVKPPYIDAAASLQNFDQRLEEIKGENIQPGDLLVITYSGHGTLVPDYNQDDKDGNFMVYGENEIPCDEAWCLYDGNFLDDQMNALLKSFEAGVKILIISDSCYSGDMLRGEIDEKVVREKYVASNLKDIKAAVILMAGCHEFQMAEEQYGLGVFTRRLIHVWDEGKFKGNYAEFYHEIIRPIPFFKKKKQLPKLVMNDAAAVSFWKETPFRNK